MFENYHSLRETCILLEGTTFHKNIRFGFLGKAFSSSIIDISQMAEKYSSNG